MDNKLENVCIFGWLEVRGLFFGVGGWMEELLFSWFSKYFPVTQQVLWKCYIEIILSIFF